MTTIEQYLTYCHVRNLRPTYVYHQQLMLQRLTRHLAGLPLLDATTTDLETFLDSRPRTSASRRTEISNLRSFYSWARDTELTLTDPARRLIQPRKQQSVPRPMPDADVRRALAEAPCEVAPILNLAVYAGLRAAEIAQLRVEDFETTPPIIFIRESKGGGQSTVPLSPTLVSILERCPLPTSGWLFPAQRGDGHLSRVRICQIANGYLHGLGISHTLHTLRHAYGTALYQQTHDLRLTQELMRHRSIQSTVGYTRLDPHEGVDAIATLRW